MAGADIKPNTTIISHTKDVSAKRRVGDQHELEHLKEMQRLKKPRKNLLQSNVPSTLSPLCCPLINDLMQQPLNLTKMMFNGELLLNAPAPGGT